MRGVYVPTDTPAPADTPTSQVKSNEGLPKETLIASLLCSVKCAYACCGVRATLPFLRQRVHTFIFWE